MLSAANSGKDRLQRRLPGHASSTGKFIAPTERDLFLFERLLWHGPLPTPFLLEYSLRFGHKSVGRARDRLTDLFHEQNTPHSGCYLDKPAAQFPALPGGYVPRNHTCVYDINSRSKKALAEAGRFVPLEHKGWWEHQLMLACVTAAFELGTLAEPKLAFIPQHEIIGSRSPAAKVSFVHDGRRYDTVLIPDALFGLSFAGKRLFCLLEVDRTTEMVTDTRFQRKSFLRSLLQYRQLVGQGEYKKAYGIAENILVIFVTTNERQMQNMMAEVTRVTQGKGNSYILFRCLPELARRGSVMALPTADWFKGPWLRAGRSIHRFELKS